MKLYAKTGYNFSTDVTLMNYAQFFLRFIEFNLKVLTPMQTHQKTNVTAVGLNTLIIARLILTLRV